MAGMPRWSDYPLGSDGKPLCPVCNLEAALGKQKFCSGCGFRLWPREETKSLSSSSSSPSSSTSSRPALPSSPIPARRPGTSPLSKEGSGPPPARPPRRPSLGKIGKSATAGSLLPESKSQQHHRLQQTAAFVQSTVITDSLFSQAPTTHLKITAPKEGVSRILYFSPYSLVSEALEQIATIFWFPQQPSAEQIRYSLYSDTLGRFLTSSRTLLSYKLPDDSELLLKGRSMRAKYAKVTVLDNFSSSTLVVEDDTTGWDLVIKLLRKNNNVSLSDEKRPLELRCAPHMLSLFVTGRPIQLQLKEEHEVWKQLPDMLPVQPMVFTLPAKAHEALSKKLSSLSASMSSSTGSPSKALERSVSLREGGSGDGSNLASSFGKSWLHQTRARKLSGKTKTKKKKNRSGSTITTSSSSSSSLPSLQSCVGDVGIVDTVDPTSESLALLIVNVDGFMADQDTTTADSAPRSFSFNPTWTVEQCVKKLLRIFPVTDDVGQFGFYTTDALWFEDTRPISSYALKPGATVEWKKRYVTYRITMPRNLQVYYHFDERSCASELFDMVIANFRNAFVDAPPEDYGLFVPGDVEGELELNRTLWSYSSLPTQTLEFRKRQQPLTIFEAGRQEVFSVDYLKPLDHALSEIISRFSLEITDGTEAENAIILQQLGLFGVPVTFKKPLLAQGIRAPATLILKMHRADSSSSNSSSSNSSDVNIWDEPDSEETIVYEREKNDKGQQVISAATLNKLVQHLTSESVSDQEFVKAFLLTYLSFSSAEQVLDKLIERYHAPPSCPGKIVQVVKLRVLNAQRLWVENYLGDFDDETLEKLTRFINFDVGSSEVSSSKMYCSKILKQISRRRTGSIAGPSSTPPQVHHSMPRRMSSATKMPKNLSSATILDFPEEDIAAQLTAIDFRVYAGIHAKEFLNQSWSKESTQHKCPGLMEMINRFNAISLWVAHMILEPTRYRVRAKRFEKLIKVADHLRQLNNFQTLMAFLGGINNSSVSRLKFTIAAMKKTSQQKLQELEKLMNMESSYAKYREALHSANPPLIPYLGVYLGDLTFIEDGNPDHLNGLINFSKRQLLYKTVSEIQQYQNQQYSIVTNDSIVSLLSSLPSLTEKDLYDKSLAREPRGATKATLPE